MSKSILGFGILVLAVVLLFSVVPVGRADTIVPALTTSGPTSLTVKSAVGAVPSGRVPAVSVKAVSNPNEIIVIEAPRQMSFESLRRSAYRYPDQGLAGRFVEMSTELPPLFDQD